MAVPGSGTAGVPDGSARVRQLEAELAAVHAVQERQLLLGSLLALVAMGVVSVVLGNAMARRVLRPLRVITATTRRISAANLHERLAVPGPADEVKHLADTIDGLLGRLEAAFAGQRRFVADASHELRTPLATMRASLDVAVAKPAPAPQTLALADRLRTELDRVDRLLEGLLVLARAQHGALADRAPVPLAGLVAEAVAERSAAIAARRLTVDASGEARVYGNPTLLARLVSNLVDNAVVHNEPGGWVRIRTGPDHGAPAPPARTVPGAATVPDDGSVPGGEPGRADRSVPGGEPGPDDGSVPGGEPGPAGGIGPGGGDGWVWLVVETGGAVLDPGHVARLAEPFRRLGADRTGSQTGTGLGLSIVAAVADAHGGRLDLYAPAEGGLRATVWLPAVGG